MGRVWEEDNCLRAPPPSPSSISLKLCSFQKPSDTNIDKIQLDSSFNNTILLGVWQNTPLTKLNLICWLWLKPFKPPSNWGYKAFWMMLVNCHCSLSTDTQSIRMHPTTTARSAVSIPLLTRRCIIASYISCQARVVALANWDRFIALQDCWCHTCKHS